MKSEVLQSSVPKNIFHFTQEGIQVTLYNTKPEKQDTLPECKQLTHGFVTSALVYQ